MVIMADNTKPQNALLQDVIGHTTKLVEYRIVEHTQNIQIITPVVTPNFDFIRVYIESYPGGYLVHDDGQVSYHLTEVDPLSDKAKKMIKDQCQRFEPIVFEDGVLSSKCDRLQYLSHHILSMTTLITLAIWSRSLEFG